MKNKIFSVYGSCLVIAIILISCYALLQKAEHRRGIVSDVVVQKKESQRDLQSPREAASGQGSKRERFPDYITVPVSSSGLDTLFGERELGDQVVLFENQTEFKGFSGRVIMLHRNADGSQTARVTGESSLANGNIRTRSAFLISSQDGYEGFIQDDGSKHVFKVSTVIGSSRELVISKVSLDQFLCVSVTNEGINYGLPAIPAGELVAKSSQSYEVDSEKDATASSLGPAHALASGGGTTSTSSSGNYTIPKLSSRSSAEKVLYLDFDGLKLTGTAWNEDQASITVAGIVGNQIDADFIKDVWWRVSAAYAPFDVNVTTNASVFANAKETKRLRVLGSSKPSQLGLSSNSGGLSYTGVFGKKYYQPSFFFISSYSDSNMVATTIIHEAGHAMGLSHDGRTSSPLLEYYIPHGVSPQKWAPLMGHSIPADIAQWSNGSYYLANNKENDLSILSSVLGSVGKGTSTLSNPIEVPLPGGRNAEIISNTDDDYFVIKGAMGKSVKITVAPRMKSNSLYPSVVLLNSNGTKITSQTSRSANGLTVSCRATFPSNYVVVKVSGAGFGKPTTAGSNGFPTGATDYGSIGPYRITAGY